MKANELKLEDVMCGDWVDVRNASPDTPHIEKITPSHLLRDEHWYGIELTPEILEKNGFSKNYHEDDLCYAQSCGDVIGIHIYGTNGLMEEMYFKYVHELQHALKLCGIKKEIEL